MKYLFFFFHLGSSWIGIAHAKVKMLVFIGSLTCKIRITATQELNISRSYSVSSFQIVRCVFLARTNCIFSS